MKKYIGFVTLASFMFVFLFSSLAKAENGGMPGTPPPPGPNTLSAPPLPMPNSNSNSGKPPVGDGETHDQKPPLPPPGNPALGGPNHEGIKTDNANGAGVSGDALLKQKLDTERKTFDNNLNKDKSAFVSDLKTKKEEFKTAKTNQKTQFCQNVTLMLEHNFTTAINQLVQYQSKVSDIIDQITASGKDTSVASDALTLSKQKLSDAQAKLAEIKALVPDTCDNITTDIYAKIKLGARDAKDLLKQSKESLHEAIMAIRALKAGASAQNQNGQNTEHPTVNNENDHNTGGTGTGQ